ncbi:hypothetical protein N0V93_003454 [Gnomoniopsis smithogilvyi]|uniref:Uncharacterized protein n=1 Tax=Gnomoniopsis smithogilvyi TaxID=1191159 RepID=A0A9W8Z0G4_9PEZI|nr:hypothetical protein N0V93_003454 [Gnomoniopsis smithogilvyi]
MKFIAAATALFAGLALAAPGAEQVQYVTLTYWTPDGTYTIQVPINGGSVEIQDTLSFSHVDSSSPVSNSICHSIGVDPTAAGDENVTELIGTDSKDIGPPQQQTYAYCYSN